MPAGWVAAGLAVGAVGSSIAGNQQAGGYSQASQQLDQLQNVANTSSSMADPYAQYRGAAAGRLNAMINDPNAITTDPGYQFAQQQGLQAVQRQESATGMGYSGNAMAGAANYASGLASQQYGSIVDRLTNLAGAGSQNAIAGANAYSSSMTAMYTGQASAKVGEGDSKASGTSGLFGGIGNAIGML